MDEVKAEDAVASSAPAAQTGTEPGQPATLVGHDIMATTFQRFHEPITATVVTMEKPTLYRGGHRESAEGTAIAVEHGERYKPEKEDGAMDQTDIESSEAGQGGKLFTDEVPPAALTDDAHGETGQWHVKDPKKSRIRVQPRIS
ncbi:unnamed protein product, partial [Ixodes pacificus]